MYIILTTMYFISNRAIFTERIKQSENNNDFINKKLR